MGNKEGSANAKHPKTLTKKDYDFLINVSGLEKTEIDAVFNDFITEFPDGKLDRNQFCRLSNKLGSVPADLDQISTYIFRAFDSDHNGSISFNEFIISYALFSPRGYVFSTHIIYIYLY
jgi:Ca2+-binding EF-hand superfamily protein